MAFTAASFSATYPVGSVAIRGNKDQVAIDPLLLRSLADAIDMMRHVVESSTLCLDGTIKPGSMQAHLSAWKRGQIINSAAYVREMYVDGKWSIPKGAVKISKQILDAETAYREELEAASLAGIPWRGTFDPRLETCIRCGGIASWRYVLNPFPKMAAEISWRLTRPENAVPICHKCVHTTKFNQIEHIRFDLAWGLWAARFEALHRWYMAVQGDQQPKGWSMEEYPLWPKEYGGSGWEDGSGALMHCLPRPPRGVKRSQVYFSALNRAMGVSTKRRARKTVRIFPH